MERASPYERTKLKKSRIFNKPKFLVVAAIPEYIRASCTLTDILKGKR